MDSVAPPRSSNSGPRADPSGSARTLPHAAFHSLAFQAEEDAAIWVRTWVCIGFEADVAMTGDLLPFTVGNHGIHVERLADGSLTGRFNKAQHGGCRVVPLQCQTGTKTKCSFTSCGYSRDRGPISAQAPDREKHLDQYLGLRPERLLSVAVIAWGPLIFAHLDPSSHARSDWHVIKPPHGIAEGETLWMEYAANWKRMAMALASAGDAGLAGTVIFPNLVLLERPDGDCMIVLQPTALGKTLCRIRFSARTEQEAQHALLSCVAVRSAQAEMAQRADEGCTNGPSVLDPEARRFEKRVCTALETQRERTSETIIYQTDYKGRW